jgi:two-component system chemotaxis sensor kinase CheA
MNELDAAVLQEFVVEGRENLDQLERDLIALETNPSSGDTLASIFRTVHTIKGAAGFTKLSRLETLAHSGETVLSRLRDGALVIDPTVTSGLLALADCLRQMLDQVERTGHDGGVDCTDLVERLTRLLDGGAPSDTGPVDQKSDQGEAGRAGQSASHVRVNVDRLDQLMNLVGELVLARNEISQFCSAQQSSVLLGTTQRLNSITTQLQEGIMKTRMQPIDNVWNKLTRVVRDSGQYCGKLVRLDMEGRDTELDRTLIEAVQDPLTHVVRNAIDHGLELPEKRIAAGKTAEGHLLLRAFHEGGQVTIEVSDDGAGIDVAALKRRALERDLLTPEQARSMSDQDAVNLIFLPGLSTAAKVTNMSGRGVGMDVVKTNIEQIGGKVSIQSHVGAGTTVRMRIPLTLAIMTALVVRSGDESYAIPQGNVLELVRVGADDPHSRIESIGDAAVYRLRGELLPLVWLNAELATERRTRSDGCPGAREGGAANIVVLQADQVKFGLIVDDVNDTQEIVVKPLGRHVRGLPIFAGATILGNGRVVLILDIPALAVQVQVLANVGHRAAIGPNESREDACEHREALLLVVGPGGGQMAIPLSQITRLAEFSGSTVECVAGQDVVQYFGGILPLTRLACLLPEPAGPTHAASITGQDTIQALVYANDGRQVGVVVDGILDTIEQSLGEVRPATRRGVVGSLVIQGRVTEILNLDAICADLTAAAVLSSQGKAS